MYDLIKKDDYDEKNTKLIQINKEDLYLYKFLDGLKNIVITDNLNKDTLEYFMIMCNKTEWVRESIAINPFNSDNYIWIDFGIQHILGEKYEEMTYKIDRMCHQNYDNIRIGMIWDLNENYNKIFRNICL